MTYRMYKLFLLLVLFCSFTSGAFAQSANSSINGTVNDTHGAIVPGATVTLTNIGTNQVLNTTSSSAGYYVFTNLSPANYNLAVHAPGFAEWVGVLTLRVAQAATVNATMNAASVSTQVTVRDVTPVIDSVNPTLSDVKNATAIETLPVANRSILNVLAFSPGVVAGGYGGQGAGYTRVNGVPGGSVNFLVDGQTMNNRWSNDLQSNPQPLPTFQEVKVITSNGDAQYGSPGVVELVTKSGTNQFHGQAFELNRNNHLQARSFNSGPQIPFLQHNEYGAQLGGPVWIPKIYNGKNKTFFFVDVEWIKQNSNAIEQYTVPTLDERKGNLSDVFVAGSDPNNPTPIQIYDPTSTTYDPITQLYNRTAFTGNVIPTNRLNPVAQKVFGITAVPGLVPLPQPNISGVQTWQYAPNYIPPSSKSTVDNKLYTAKLDQVFGPNRLAARYTYTDNTTLRPEYYAPTEPDQGTSGGHNGSLTFTSAIGARAVNVAHIGVQYNHNFSGPISIAGVSDALKLPTYTDQVGWPSFYFDGNFDNYWVGIDRDNPKDYPDSTVTANDQFSYNRGNHQLMFGFDINNTRISTFEIGQPGGGYNFSGNFTALQSATVGSPVDNTGMGLADFLLGDTDSVNLNIYPHYHTRQTEYDGYAQDDWRVTPRLTLNLGVRYQYWTAFEDSSGLASTLDPNVAGGEVVYQGSGALPAQTSQAVLTSFQTAAGLGGPGLPIVSAAKANYPLNLWNMPKNNWEPRLGFAYLLNNKTVLRGGWGIYQWAIPLQQYQQASRKNPPFSYSAALSPGEINGASTNAAAAELEFPIADAAYGGPCAAINPNCTTPDFYMLGNNSTLILNTSNVSIAQNNGFNIAPMDPNYKASTTQEWNLSIARDLFWHTGFQLSYIGNHSYNLLQTDPINYVIPRNLCAAAGSSNVAQCETGTQPFMRAFPVFGTSGSQANSLYRYIGYANSNILQAQVTHTYGSGLTLQAYFTWGRYLTTSESGFLGSGTPAGSGGGQSATQMMVPAALTPGYSLSNYASGASTSDRLRAVYANDPTLPDKTFKFNLHYQFPFGKGQRFLGNAHGILNALVSGYNISPFFLWHSGFYFSPRFTQLSSNYYLAPGKTGILAPNQRTTQHWFDASVWDITTGAPYADQTYIKYPVSDSAHADYRNNIPSNYMTGPGFNEMDATVYKLTPLWKNLVFDMEAQVFNVYNHQNLGMPNSSGVITGQNSGNTPRTIQLQGKFIF
jgi:hypothetical protein